MMVNWTPGFFVFFSLKLIFFYLLCAANLYTVIEYDNLKLFVFATSANELNIIWTFTQFTWWICFGYTILMTFQLLLYPFYKRGNKVVQSLFSEWFSILVAAYTLVVGVLFAAGISFYTLFERKSPRVAVLVPDYLYALNIFKTTAVHTIMPILGIVTFVWRTKLNNEKNILKYSKVWTKGMILPIIYIIFYIVFAKLKYDPYPVTNLKANEGYWVLPIVLLSFLFSLTLFTCIGNRINKKIHSQKFQKYIKNA